MKGVETKVCWTAATMQNKKGREGAILFPRGEEMQKQYEALVTIFKLMIPKSAFS